MTTTATVIIDEVQCVPELFLAIEEVVDSDFRPKVLAMRGRSGEGR